MASERAAGVARQDGNEPGATVSGHFDHCQNCSHRPLIPVMDFGHHPPCDSLLRPEQLAKPEAFYPLHVFRCERCGLVQIDYAVDPAELFYEGYPYMTGITGALKTNFDAMAAKVIETLRLKPGRLVLDIGSNDGTILQGFKTRGMRVLGVEPTGIAKIANSRGIPTRQAFFSEEVARDIRQAEGPASLITAANVFAHVANLGPCLRGIHALLADDGTFISESHYLLDLIDTLQYDTIYHEHLRFYSIKPMQDMMNRFGFSVVDVERIPNHGGSIRVYAVKGTAGRPSERMCDLVKQEEAYGLYGAALYETFAQRVRQSKWKLMRLLSDLKTNGHRIVGIGSPGRSSTVMNYCGIGPDYLDYTAEQATSLKVGLFTPGTHVPVVDEQRLFDEQPEYALVLAWHLGEGLPRKLRSKGLRSKFIMPLPDPVVLDW
ncbi:MAG: hypothetical protein NBKEAIPA_02155 [Nitrospirae bacterium]|nr:MAG: putative methyltransferase [Nitrospira sp. OLB3]MBV6470240.1 hypothetical protein [Nitrospirota bacterium]MCE7964272.1 class I SAM-dependent methyltransferase [Nitrospira sp. NTP2]MCK6492651.1 class I SAM-dependent methyltransferase [Nitrospira sp.]MEB2337278.1 class I SAM-dependent methyltransferase [Nitrospirales bacterium]